MYTHTFLRPADFATRVLPMANVQQCKKARPYPLFCAKRGVNQTSLFAPGMQEATIDSKGINPSWAAARRWAAASLQSAPPPPMLGIPGGSVAAQRSHRAVGS
jgi:hypothetical protein